MNERLRAPLCAAVALLIGGDLAARGASALADPGRFLCPYLWLFLAFEALRRRRRLLDEEAFLLGAAAGLLWDGVFAKSLHDGTSLLDGNWLAAALACLDWGLLTVVSLHVVDAVRRRPSETSSKDAPGFPEAAALALISAAAAARYVYDAAAGRSRFSLMLGPAWPIADLLFAAAAAALARRALSRARADAPPARERGLRALAAFGAWLPGARLAARAGGADFTPVSLLLIAAWTAALGAWLWRLWKARADEGAPPRRAARSILALAAWRAAAGAALWLWFGPAQDGGGGAGAFEAFVDLPTRLVFLSVFFTSRLEI